MFRAGILAAGLTALTAATCLPLMGAQSQAPRAKSASVFTQSRSYLGIGVADISEERAKAVGLKDPQGVEVTHVMEDAPAAKAGVKQGDVILEYNGQRVEGGEQFVRMVQETPSGHKATLQLWRNGNKQTVTATIGVRQERQFVLAVPGAPMPPMPPMPPESLAMPDIPLDNFSWRSTVLGVETEALNSQLATFFGVKEGVLVRTVNQGSAADTAGLKAGDVITKIDGQAISTPRAIATLLRKSGHNASLTVVRNHKELTLNVKLSRNLLRLDESFPGVRSLQPETL